MGLFFMGWKPGVGSVLKILKYETDDPLTLANSAYNRFYFNSETQNLSYIWDKFYFSTGFNPGVYPGSTGVNGNLYVIEGASPSQARRALVNQTVSGSDYFLFYEIFPRFPDMELPHKNRTFSGLSISAQ
ncbi:hypothetical protein, partial [Brucella intermedia]|uniref:hypothetical protein n=1 Tax=Brucella intermedia TaxID=94625 RepID=UPI00124D8C9D